MQIFREIQWNIKINCLIHKRNEADICLFISSEIKVDWPLSVHEAMINSRFEAAALAELQK